MKVYVHFCHRLEILSGKSTVERLRPQGESRTEVWSLRRCQSWRAPRKDYRADCEGF